MELSHEDSLRLNVLLTQDLQAIRIDESAMIVYALTSKGEAKVQLMPNCRDDRYLYHVRELFSSHALDSPGGYPVYIERWTRMGQTRTESLHGLLLLGEPEAIVAIANAPGLTEELARCAWWAMPTVDIARSLLENTAVSKSEFAKELAQFLLGYIPFETETLAIVDSVRLVLQPDLISEVERQELWSKGNQKSVFYLGFLHAIPDALPTQTIQHRQWQEAQQSLFALCENNNRYAIQLYRLLSAMGQTFLATVEMALKKIYDQDAMVALLNSFDKYFVTFRPEFELKSREFSEILERVSSLIASDGDILLQDLLTKVPQLKPQVHAMLVLACVGEKLSDPIFAQTDAVGSLMRKKLLPITQPLLESIGILRQDR